MKQITEDYCSFEVAQLLKEKGFDESVNRFYETSTGKPLLVRCEYCRNSFTIDYAAPTLQMVLKWLREVHNIFIDIMTYTTGSKIQFRWVGYDKGRLFSQEEGRTIYFDSYEEAVEAALLYVLKNLI